jgi:hypothetical protein
MLESSQIGSPVLSGSLSGPTAAIGDLIEYEFLCTILYGPSICFLHGTSHHFASKYRLPFKMALTSPFPVQSTLPISTHDIRCLRNILEME